MDNSRTRNRRWLRIASGAHSPFATPAFDALLADRADDYPEVTFRLFGIQPIYSAAEAVSRLAGLVCGPEHRRKARGAIDPGVGD
jgi:hypothetical protein